jgi:hypothetical protein
VNLSELGVLEQYQHKRAAVLGSKKVLEIKRAKIKESQRNRSCLRK